MFNCQLISIITCHNRDVQPLTIWQNVPDNEHQNLTRSNLNCMYYAPLLSKSGLPCNILKWTFSHNTGDVYIHCTCTCYNKDTLTVLANTCTLPINLLALVTVVEF